ncbi:MAG: NAD-glutamate dehydrogenase [Actinomycetales bacterium]|nr:NAD-glutamate dehydrogenase [Actinomycetales bacterium]
MRAQVVGEGANLALSRLVRIADAIAGVRLSTDAIDDSAGVNATDHEVNIKIPLGPALSCARHHPSSSATPGARVDDRRGRPIGAACAIFTHEQNVLLGNARAQA